MGDEQIQGPEGRLGAQDDTGPDPEPSAPSIGFSTVRRAVFRGLLAGLAGAGLCAGLASVFELFNAGYFALHGFLAGGVLGLVALLEAVGWGPTPPARRVVTVALASWVLGAILCYGSLLQTEYAGSIFQGHDRERAFESVKWLLLLTQNHPDPYVAMFALVGLLFGLTTLARGAGLGVMEASAATLVGCTPVGFLVLLNSTLCDAIVDPRFVFGMLVIGGALLPVVAWLGDRVERRFFSASTCPPTKRRALAWGCVASLVIAAPAAQALAKSRQGRREAFTRVFEPLLEESNAAQRTRDFVELHRLTQELNAMPLGVVDRMMVSIHWLEAAWWLGVEGPPHPTPEQRAWLTSMDADPFNRLERARWRLKHDTALAGALLDADHALSSMGPTVDRVVLRAELHARLGNAAKSVADLKQAATLGATPEELTRIRKLMH